MNKIIRLILACTFLTCLTGCNNSIREEETDSNIETVEPNESNIIERSLLVKEFKCSVLNDNGIADMNSQTIILNNGEVYTYVTGNALYSNDEQCKQFSNIPIKKIHSSYYVGNNNDIYIKDNDKLKKIDINEMQTVEKKLLFDDNLIKYGYAELTEDDGYPTDTFGYIKNYILKKDGKLYYRFYKYNDHHAWATVTFLKDILWEKSEQFNNILDFKQENYVITMIISDSGLYYLKEVETEECLKYEDIACQKDYVKSELYDKYKDEIKYINVEYTVFKNNDIIRTSVFVNN